MDNGDNIGSAARSEKDSPIKPGRTELNPSIAVENQKPPLAVSSLNASASDAVKQLPKVSVTESPKIDQSPNTEINYPLYALREAQQLEKHLEGRKDSRGNSELTIIPQVTDSEGRSVTRDGAPSDFNRRIKQSYLDALQSSANTEPARNQRLFQVDQQIKDIAKALNLKDSPSLEHITAIKKPENIAQLTPAQRQSVSELENLLKQKEIINSSSVKSIEKQYENFLERTNQTSALNDFRRWKPLLETLPFQSWLDLSGASTNSQRIIEEGKNPFTAHHKAVRALNETSSNTYMADMYFRNAIEAADKLDPKALDANIARVKLQTKTEKDKAPPDRFTLTSLKAEEEALILLKASPGLMRVAYADFLLNSGNRDQAFHQLIAAADNPAAIAIINKNNGYYEQLVDRSLHGDKSIITPAHRASEQLEDFNNHFNSALGHLKSGDKERAKEEFQTAYNSAQEARQSIQGVDTQDMGHNAQLFAEAINREKNKSPETINHEKLKAMEDLQQHYKTLAHLPALTALAQAKAELTVSADNGKVSTERNQIVRSLIAYADSDSRLGDLTGIKQQVDYIKELVHEHSYGEMAWDYLRRNSGSIVALGAGFGVAGLTCWSGPGAALAGAAAAGAVAGTLTDWAVGNEVSLESFGGHCLEGAGGGLGKVVQGSMAANTGIVSRFPKPLVGPAIGASSSAATGAIEHLGDIGTPGVYMAKVGFDTIAGGILRGPRSFIAKKAPHMKGFVLSPGFSHVLKGPAEQLFEAGKP